MTPEYLMAITRVCIVLRKIVAWHEKEAWEGTPKRMPYALFEAGQDALATLDRLSAP